MLTRQDYIQKITDTFALLETSFRNRILLNLYDSNIISEDFFEGLLNIIYGLNLKNLNKSKKNAAAIDLVDATKKVAYQITSTVSQQKIQKTIDGFIKKDLHKSIDSLYIFLLRKKRPQYSVFNQASTIKFSDKNILDFTDLIKDIDKMSTTDLQKICDYLSQEVKYYNELNSLNNQTDIKAIINYKSLIKRKALLDDFQLEGSMYGFEEALIEINKAFSIGLIKTGLEVKPIHRFIDPFAKDSLERLQYKFMGLHSLYKTYLKTGEIEPNNHRFFPNNQKDTVDVFNSYRRDLVKDFNVLLKKYGEQEIRVPY